MVAWNTIRVSHVKILSVADVSGINRIGPGRPKNKGIEFIRMFQNIPQFHEAFIGFHPGRATEIKEDAVRVKDNIIEKKGGEDQQ
jgi:hypothetical protein